VHLAANLNDDLASDANIGDRAIGERATANYKIHRLAAAYLGNTRPVRMDGV
jgi:hypothetical protein